jgi:hypothetical protein
MRSKVVLQHENTTLMIVSCDYSDQIKITFSLLVYPYQYHPLKP